MSNSNLHKAKKEANDEFYTQLSDVENEVEHYTKHFKDAHVFCNCDDHRWSAFVEYFSMNFELLGLKKLTAVHYDANEVSYKLEITGDTNGDGKIDGGDLVETVLEGDGDFRNQESIDILKECDIVVTNPPFSLFREYIAQLTEYDKKFLIVGNMNAITYKEIFPLIKKDKMWLGISPRNMTFKLPDNSLKSINAVWFTNLDHKKRHEKFIGYKTYKGNEKDYPKYDNYDAINIDKVVDIPTDYMDTMGVPITFLGKLDPEQFEIVDANTKVSNNQVPIKKHGLIKDKHGSVLGKPKYVRLLIKRK